MRYGAVDAGAAWHTIAGDFAFEPGATEKAMHISNRDPWVAGALFVALAALSSCGKAEHTARAGAHATRPAVKKGSDARALELADMVSAVSAGKTSVEIDLKFALRERPLVGVPVDIDVALVPGRDFDQVYATFSASDGLEVMKGGRMPQIEHPEPRAPISHTVTIVPQRDGIFFVSATVLADSPTNSVSHLFSIPVIAGAGISAPVASGRASPMAARPPGGTH
jgi:hypothetical protein